MKNIPKFTKKRPSIRSIKENACSVIRKTPSQVFSLETGKFFQSSLFAQYLAWHRMGGSVDIESLILI